MEAAERSGALPMAQPLNETPATEARSARASTVTESRWGPRLLAKGGVHFALWAPAIDTLGLAVEGAGAALTMTRTEHGWHEIATQLAAAGSRYSFVLPDGTRVPDPASRFQPNDVHGASEVVDPHSYAWRDARWRGRPWHEAVLYELHVGAFTPAGTFAGAAEKLAHLAELGVTAIELMPIGDFPGRWNWGYDGVFPYAPDASYGRPEDLKAFVDAAHAAGLMVILDVVYNHFGPEGNYLGRYAPEFFTERHHTPWGAGINFDGARSAPVREFFCDNALYWIHEFHFDGLRLDAVHAILDDSPVHILEELARRVRTSVAGRHVHLILENEDNQAARLARNAGGQPILYSAQWNDDIHHVLHTAATGELAGYYAEYLGDDQKLGRALAEGFAFQGEQMHFRGSPRGEPSAHLPPEAFIAFIQNHDQIGNRAFGERLCELATLEAYRAVVAVYLLLPQIPMLFMGEEWQAQQPFSFFCDFHGELAEAIRTGRRAEFSRFPEFQNPDAHARIPDPLALETFLSARLDWDALSVRAHAAGLEWYRELLRVRQREIVPRIPRIGGGAARFEVLGPLAVCVRWRAGEEEDLVLLTNLCHAPLRCAQAIDGRAIWTETEGAEHGVLPPWAVRWLLVPPS